MKEFLYQWKQFGFRVALYNVWFLVCARTLGAKRMTITKKKEACMKPIIIVSKPFDLIREDVWAILKGASINFAGALALALLTYALDLVSKVSFDPQWALAGLATALLATLVNVGRTYLTKRTYVK